MLEVRGYSEGGFCFLYDGKPISVQDALVKYGKFSKRTVNALNRNNLTNESDLAAFEVLAESLHKGLTAASCRQVLLQHYNIDVMKTDYYELRASEISDLQKVFNIARYKLPRYELCHSSLYYFFRYLSNKK